MTLTKQGCLLLILVGAFVSSGLQAKEPSLFDVAHQKMKPNVYTSIDSMLVYQNNKLVSQHYYGRFNSNTTHRTHSTFKSINALITLLAIDQGLLQRDEFALPLLSRFAKPTRTDRRRQQIRVKHLLNMTSGLACDEAPGSNGPNHEFGVDEGQTPLQYSLDIPMSSKPGEQWQYCSANSFLLAASVSAALARANRENIFEFADKYLMQPLEIKNYRFTKSANGKFLNGQGNAHFLPSDLAKFGLLLLNNGIWNNQRLLSESSIQSLLIPGELINWSFIDLPQSSAPPKTKYSNQWYHTSFALQSQVIAIIHSWGNGGQYIFVVPALEAVVIFTGSNQGNFAKQKQPFEIMIKYVLPQLLLNPR